MYHNNGQLPTVIYSTLIPSSPYQTSQSYSPTARSSVQKFENDRDSFLCSKCNRT